MIIKVFLECILTIFAGLDQVVMPVLPSGLSQVLSSVTRFIQSGIHFVFTFLDKNYCSQLFSWWITFGAMILAYELILSVWHLVTGNSHTQPISSDNGSNGVYDFGSNAGGTH